MKDSLKYLKFWQKKRNELQINDDPQADWLSMQSLLETHLPVNNHPGIKKGSFFKGKIFKMLPKLLVTFSAAAMIYTASHLILKKVHQHHPRHSKFNKERLFTDSTYKDSLNADAALLGDSELSVNQPQADDSNASASVVNEKELTGSSSNDSPNKITANGRTSSSGTVHATTASAQNKNQQGIITADNKLASVSPSDKTIPDNKLSSASSSGSKTNTGNKLNAASLSTIKTVPDNKSGSFPSSGNKTNMAKKLNATLPSNTRTVNGHKLDAAISSSNKTTLGNKPGNGLLTNHNGATNRSKLTAGLTSGNKNTGSNKRRSNSVTDNKIIHGNRPGAALLKNNSALLSASKNNKRGNTHNGYLPSGSSKIEPVIETQTAGGLDKDENDARTNNLHNKQQEVLTAAPPQALNDAVRSNKAADSKKPDQKPDSKLLADQSKNNNTKNKKDKQSKSAKPTGQKSSGLSTLDWGVLGGVNASGSFTSSKQNANFYGSSPVDAYFGLFANYNLNDKWAVGLQTQFYSPQSITSSYTHANESKVDSGQSLQITASRKLYTINIPINVIYKLTDNFSLMGGPVIGIPVKQINASSTLLPATIKNDSTYYAKISGILNQTNYEQKLNIGLNVGVGFHYKRWLFEASYLKSLTGYSISNDLGTYKSGGGTFQFTIGFQINKPKQ